MSSISRQICFVLIVVSVMGSQNKVFAYYHPDTEDERMTIVDCHMFHQILARYRRAIGFEGTHLEVPPCFLSVYFNKCLIALGSSELSRARILGAVHYKQKIIVHRDLGYLLETMSKITCYAEEYRITEKGLEIDISQKVFNDKDALMWEAVLTGLCLLPKSSTKKTAYTNGQANGHANGHTNGHANGHANGTSKILAGGLGNFGVYKEEMINTDGKTGIRFAKASLDYQPQHLFPWTAKIVGFKKPIAHGLFTMAAAINRIMKAEREMYHDVYPLHLETTFRRPLYLGDSGLLQYEKPTGPKRLSHFKVVDLKSRQVFVDGSIFVGSNEKLE